jgi:hypothetical protein
MKGDEEEGVKGGCLKEEAMDDRVKDKSHEEEANGSSKEKTAKVRSFGDGNLLDDVINYDERVADRTRVLNKVRGSLLLFVEGHLAGDLELSFFLCEMITFYQTSHLRFFVDAHHDDRAAIAVHLGLEKERNVKDDEGLETDEGDEDLFHHLAANSGVGDLVEPFSFGFV